MRYYLYMQCYIISFQTSLSDKTRLENAIKSYGTWAKITPSTWAVVTEKPASDIRDHILSYLAQGDRLMVIRSGTEAAWSNAMASNDWLKKNL